MSKTTIYVIGKDERQKYLARYLQEQGVMVLRSEEFDPEKLKGIDYLVGPVTFYRDGRVSPEVAESCNKAGVKVINYMECENFLQKNAKLTAEGLLAIIIGNTNFSLENANILIFGNGRCGKAILHVLKCFSCHVDIYDIVPDSIPEIAYHIVINTIPAPVILREHLLKLKPDCILFEVASPPGGFDQVAMEDMGLTLIGCPGIPGKYSPQSAGYAIGETVIAFTRKENSINEIRI